MLPIFDLLKPSRTVFFFFFLDLTRTTLSSQPSLRLQFLIKIIPTLSFVSSNFFQEVEEYIMYLLIIVQKPSLYLQTIFIIAVFVLQPSLFSVRPLRSLHLFFV